MKPENVRGACEKSLQDWNMNYFDLYLIHWPFCFKADEKTKATLYDENGVAIADSTWNLEDTWKAMEELVDLGLVKSIGVSNFSVSLLKKLISIPNLKYKPAVNQVELHPYLPQTELRQFCESNGIIVEAYSSLGSGKAPSLLENDVIIQESTGLGISPSSLLLSWARQQNIPVIPKSCNKSRISDNFHHCRIPEEVMQRINNITQRHRYIDPINFWKHPMPQ